MNRLIVEPTEENIIKTLKENTLSRNTDVFSIINFISKHSDYTSIAINGVWGSGKTFLIKQIELMFRYMNSTSNISAQDKNNLSDVIYRYKEAFSNTAESSSFLTLYYDAWLYDDHDDPLISLLYAISTIYGKEYSEMPSRETLLQKLSSVADILNFWSSGSLYNLVTRLKSTNATQQIEDLESIKAKLEDAINSILGSNKRIIIFIDEIDRCRPDYAIKLLERIKHFFCMENVTFVFSVNIGQLNAAIEKFYGYNFNSGRYLNKFFDVTFEVPSLDENTFFRYAKISKSDSSYYVKSYYLSLFKSLNLSLREQCLFAERTEPIIEELLKKSSSSFIVSQESLFCDILFGLLIAAINVSDAKRYSDFIRGDDDALLKQAISGWPEGESFINKILFNGTETTREEQVSACLSIYHHVFNGAAIKRWDNCSIDFSDDQKGRILKRTIF